MVFFRLIICTLLLLAGTLKGLRAQPPASGPFVIPVVFHILNSDPNSITDQMVIDALKELNDAFAHRGMYSVDSTGADTRIQFCLARTAPDGGLTTGIDRINTYYENNDMDMEGGVPPDLIVWDRTRYANIWVVNSIQGEIKPSRFECGKWTRMGVGGYAGAGSGVVVSGLSTPLLAHEMGHYLSLLHTFEGMNCANNDCSLDGDMVCDTPPDRTTTGSPCNRPDNSCNTDTLSGPFTTNVPDNVGNFMDYGSACPTVFTPGQGERMRNFLASFNGGSLTTSDRCNLPCGENIQAAFHWNSNPHPITGDKVKFANISTGATTYEWSVNDVFVGNMAELEQLFSAPGKYKISLKAYTNNPLCYSSYTGNVFVNCGVDARFSPDKRIIASDTSTYADSVFLWNKSYGADTYRWFISDEKGLNESVVSSIKDLTYIFPKPGTYRIWLEASKGGCIDTSTVYSLQVLDPKQDAAITVNAVDCYKNDSIRIVFTIYNNGYDTIPAGTSVNFYDKSPLLAGATKLNNPFLTKNPILGKCGATFTHIIAANRFKLDSIGLAVDDEKKMDELSRTNNYASARGFQYKLKLLPGDTTVYTNSDVVLQLSFTPNRSRSVTWTASRPINCTNCNGATVLITESTVVKAKVESVYGCLDSVSSRINVFPVDMYMKVYKSYCYENNKMILESLLCLGNNHESLTSRLRIDYFDRDSTAPGAKRIGTKFISQNQVFFNGCLQFSDTVVNDRAPSIHVYINTDKAIPEVNLLNNHATAAFTPFRLSLSQQTIQLLRGEPKKIDIITDTTGLGSISWRPSDQLSCSNCAAPVITSKTNTKLELIGLDRNKCSDTAIINVLTSYQNGVVLPNVFTPDGDGLNDHFYVIASKEVTAVKHMQIFNRWGEKVFEINNVKPNEYSGGWNGYYKGKPAPTGTYVYLVQVKMADGKTETLKGNVTVVR